LRRDHTLLYVELVLATLSAVMFAVTLAWPDWIEEVFGIDPDRGNGSLEWAIVVALGLVAVSLGAAARKTHRRLVARS
jgi:hypothetical protein